MVAWFVKRRCSPIGIDVGSSAVKLLQLDAAHTRVHEAARWELTVGADPADRVAEIAAAIRAAREGRDFRGRDAVFSIHSDDLFVQNLRVPQLSGEELARTVRSEAAAQLPFDDRDAEIRYLEAADVRQGESLRREIILLACHRPALVRTLSLADAAGLRPLAIDVEPVALLRCYAQQFRRDQDQGQCVLFVHVGAARTAAVIARDFEPMFIKYIDVGGRQLDAAVGEQLKLSATDAAALRRHNGDRRSDRRDPEIERGIADAIRPVLDRLAGELSMCLRYYGVTFRGCPVGRIVLCGGEANEALLEWLRQCLEQNAPCELGDPLRSFQTNIASGRNTQWDIAAGLALHER